MPPESRPCDEWPNLTGYQMEERRKRLEEEASRLLGQMLFEFGRLDMQVNLCAVWVDEGNRLDELTARVEGMTFGEKLEFLETTVEASFPKHSKPYNAYTAWLKRTHRARRQRNELAHGRWGIEAKDNLIVNVHGLPTSANQRSRGYTIVELEGILTELQRLQTELNNLRKQHPL
jgi:hypothetical protein